MKPSIKILFSVIFLSLIIIFTIIFTLIKPVTIKKIPDDIAVMKEQCAGQPVPRFCYLDYIQAKKNPDLCSVFEIEEEKRRAEIDQDRRAQVGTGERSEKIRTYNYPQSRVTDHRINMSSYNLPAVMDGEIDLFIDELATQEEAARLAAAGFEA